MSDSDDALSDSDPLQAALAGAGASEPLGDMGGVLQPIVAKVADWWKAQPSWAEQAQQFAGRNPSDLLNDPAFTQFVMGMTGPGMTKSVGPKGITAYHGSPHDFDAFDMSKIGSGEGAQAYGHGLYFAEQEGTAKAYRSQLSDRHFNTPDGLMPHGEVWQQLRDAAQEAGNLHPDQSGTIARRIVDDMERGGIKAALRGYDSIRHAASDYVGGDPRFIAGAQAALEKANELQIGSLNKGRIYQVNIGADPERFLDWDKPLSEQSPKVREALINAGADPEIQSFHGEQLYRRLGENLQQGKADTQQPHLLAANYLREAGIPGIKYLDQFSRLGNIPSGLEQAAQDVINFYGGDRAAAARHFENRISGRPSPNSNNDIPFRSDRPGNPHEVLDFLKNGEFTPPSHNYVVFDDKIIDIIKKYGLAGLMAGGIGGQGEERQ